MKRHIGILAAVAAGTILAPFAASPAAHAAAQSANMARMITAPEAHTGAQPSLAALRSSFMQVYPRVMNAMRPCSEAKVAMDKDLQAWAQGNRNPRKLAQDAARTETACTAAGISLRTIVIPGPLRHAPYVRPFIRDAQQYAAASADLGAVLIRALEGDNSPALLTRAKADIHTINAANTDAGRQLTAIKTAWFS